MPALDVAACKSDAIVLAHELELLTTIGDTSTGGRRSARYDIHRPKPSTALLGLPEGASSQ